MLPYSDNSRSHNSGEQAKEARKKATEFLKSIKKKDFKLLKTNKKDWIDESSEMALQEWVDCFK